MGLTAFYQYVLSVTLNQQLQYVSVFTTEVFAYYLHYRLLLVTQCRQVTQTSLPDVCQRCAEYISEMRQLFVGDVLILKSINHDLEENVRDKSKKSKWRKRGQSVVNESELNTVELVELLQQSAFEHLTTFRQLKARDFGSVASIVTTDFEALYSYKHGDYQRCLQLSTQNVRALLNPVLGMVHVVLLPEFIQLLDDDIVSLTAMTLIVDPGCRLKDNNFCIGQLSLSLYLMTQCQLKLRHSVTSLAQTHEYITVAQRKYLLDRTLDRLTLKLSKCKITAHLRMIVNNW